MQHVVLCCSDFRCLSAMSGENIYDSAVSPNLWFFEHVSLWQRENKFVNTAFLCDLTSRTGFATKNIVMYCFVNLKMLVYFLQRNGKVPWSCCKSQKHSMWNPRQFWIGSRSWKTVATCKLLHRLWTQCSCGAHCSRSHHLVRHGSTIFRTEIPVAGLNRTVENVS